jgi:drug/metabolite transporter (DMT)-like permease
MFQIGVVVLVGMALDWALYYRLISLLGQGIRSRDGYRTFLFPRVLMTVVSLVVIGYSISKDHSNAAAIIVGSVLFAGSSFYAVCRFYRGDEIPRWS